MVLLNQAFRSKVYEKSCFVASSIDLAVGFTHGEKTPTNRQRAKKGKEKAIDPLVDPSDDIFTSTGNRLRPQLHLATPATALRTADDSPTKRLKVASTKLTDSNNAAMNILFSPLSGSRDDPTPFLQRTFMTPVQPRDQVSNVKVPFLD